MTSSCAQVTNKKKADKRDHNNNIYVDYINKLKDYAGQGQTRGYQTQGRQQLSLLRVNFQSAPKQK